MSVSAHGPALSVLLEQASQCLLAVRSGRSLTEALAACPAAARPGTQALSFHVLRWLGSAEAVRDLLAPKRPPPPVDALLTTALALMWSAGAPLYPDHTLVDQAVVAAKHRVPAAAGFINAVLRRYLRERATLSVAAQNSPIGAYNHPVWWIERIKADWPRQWAALLGAANEQAPMVLRVNARRVSAADYVQRLAHAGRRARQVGLQAVCLEQPCNVQELPGFLDGDVSVQDGAAQRAAPLLVGGVDGIARLAAGARVLDACAAPGGKTAHLLECADLDLLALDSDPQRAQRIHDTLGRLKLQAAVRVGDARQPAAWWDGRPFDAILLDAPCTASGIVRRHPDVRWLRRLEDIATLAATQAAMLQALWPLLKPGGRLLYATCSLFRAEGQGQIDAFLQREGPASVRWDPASPGHLLPLPDNLPQGASPTSAPADDGFFYALLHKA